MSQEQDNLVLMRQIYAAYDQRDAGAMVAALAEDCRYESMEPTKVVRFGSLYVGKSGFLQALSDIAADWDLVSYRPTRMVADGDYVVVLADVAFRHRATGALVKIDKVDTWQLRDGRIIRFKEYYDTLKVEQIVKRVASAKAATRRPAPKRGKRSAPKRSARSRRPVAKAKRRRARGRR